MFHSLLKHKAKEIAVIAEASFSNGLPVACRFVNGWFCVVCNGVTEHSKLDGSQVCDVCKTAKISVIHSAQFVEYQKFLSMISYYSAKIEFEAIKKAVGSEIDEDRNVSWWIMVRGQLHSIKKLDEAIKMQSFRLKQMEAGV